MCNIFNTHPSICHRHSGREQHFGARSKHFVGSLTDAFSGTECARMRIVANVAFSIYLVYFICINYMYQ